MCIATVCKRGCDTIDFEINLIMLINSNQTFKLPKTVADLGESPLSTLAGFNSHQSHKRIKSIYILLNIISKVKPKTVSQFRYLDFNPMKQIPQTLQPAISQMLMKRKSL